MKLKKIMALTLAGCLVLSATACGGSGDTTATTAGTTTAGDSTTAADPAEADTEAEG